MANAHPIGTQTPTSNAFCRLPTVARTSGRYTPIGAQPTRELSKSKQSRAAELGASAASASPPSELPPPDSLTHDVDTPPPPPPPPPSPPPTPTPPPTLPPPTPGDARSLAGSGAPPTTTPKMAPAALSDRSRRSTTELLAELRAAVNLVFDEAGEAAGGRQPVSMGESSLGVQCLCGALEQLLSHGDAARAPFAQLLCGCGCESVRGCGCRCGCRCGCGCGFVVWYARFDVVRRLLAGLASTQFGVFRRCTFWQCAASLSLLLLS